MLKSQHYLFENYSDEPESFIKEVWDTSTNGTLHDEVSQFS